VKGVSLETDGVEGKAEMHTVIRDRVYPLIESRVQLADDVHFPLRSNEAEK
jgi:hypothetical protein